VVRTEPKGATVYLDERIAGSSPYEQVNLKPGHTRVRIDKEGYQPLEGSVTVKAGRSQTYL